MRCRRGPVICNVGTEESAFYPLFTRANLLQPWDKRNVEGGEIRTMSSAPASAAERVSIHYF